MWYNDRKAIIGEEIPLGRSALPPQSGNRNFSGLCRLYGIIATVKLWHSKNCLQGEALCGRAAPQFL